MKKNEFSVKLDFFVKLSVIGKVAVLTQTSLSSSIV